ncbi:glutamyl-tRNA(Gln) amidotransferase subunit C, mitochondrial-like [Centruroides sculpturatus]|uniref:glutamyl-tRNA(Gln) amidotransferase subunit C, mitochondrial-like n=1 Tax=Centruroides sculpturatus TaxID=218467 RepID=UPI000C6D734B|nr:glutamyl-tRNA(Gln) amidotransferase subunit C, mitochondrial-like [Centruroides sculpturatus]
MFSSIRIFLSCTSKLSAISVNTKCFLSKVPQTPVSKVDPKKNTVQVDHSTVEELERISLVDFANEDAIKSLEEAVQFADLLSTVDTTDVEPLITTLEDRELYLQEDIVKDGNYRDLILKNAQNVKEYYFVAPKAKIPNVENEEQKEHKHKEN